MITVSPSPSVGAVLAEAADARATVVLSGHVQPDADALGSTLSLAEGLRRRGARVLATFPDPFTLPASLGWLPGAEGLVPSSAVPSSPDVFVSLDAASPGRLGELAALLDDSRLSVVVDHHASNRGFGSVCVVDPTAPATAKSPTRRPSASVSTREAKRSASARSCVTSSSVICSERWHSLRNRMISSPVWLSRLPVGSSASSSDGRFTRARAIAARCCSPPESSAGRCAMRSRNPTRSSASRTRAARSPRSTSAKRIGNSRFSSRVMLGIRWNAWKIIPTVCRR